MPAFLGDKDRLIQVMTNILSNSIKFTPLGGRIVIAAHHETTPVSQIVVSVSDTGVGIPEGELNLIFEKFHRSGDVLTNNAEGTGLGLAITRQIVEYHGGTIWAESTLGQGSTFIFTLPLDRSWNIKGEQQTRIPAVLAPSSPKLQCSSPASVSVCCSQFLLLRLFPLDFGLSLEVHYSMFQRLIRTLKQRNCSPRQFSSFPCSLFSHLS